MGLQSATELIERGRLVYRAMRYREQAARYGAVANSLLEAIAVAEGGDATKLEVLLEELLQVESPQDPLLDWREEPVTLGASTPDPCDLGKPPLELDSGREKQRMVVIQNADRNIARNREQHVAEAKAMPTLPATGITTQGVTTQGITAKGDASQLREEEAAGKRQAIGKKPDSGKKPEIDKKPDSGKRPDSEKKPANGHNRVTGPQRETGPKRQAGFERQAGPRRTKKRIPLDVMASVVVHGVLLLVLGVWFIAVVDPTPVLSVVAGTVETQEVLMETPMEADSELEKPLEEQMEGGAIEIPMPISPQSGVEALEMGALAAGLEIAEEVGGGLGELRELAGANAPGNRVVDGAEFFGTKATGNTFVYIVDASPSMRRDRAFEAAKREILQSLGSMKPKQRFSILFFGGVVDRIELEPGQGGERLISATPENLAKAVQWMHNAQIQPEGKVPIDAVREALEMDPDGIFLLFDGDTKLDNWTEAIAELNRSDGLLGDGTPKVPIHVVHFFREEFQRSMQWLATSNRGTYRFVPRPSLAGRSLD